MSDSFPNALFDLVAPCFRLVGESLQQVRRSVARLGDELLDLPLEPVFHVEQALEKLVGLDVWGGAKTDETLNERIVSVGVGVIEIAQESVVGEERRPADKVVRTVGIELSCSFWQSGHTS